MSAPRSRTVKSLPVVVAGALAALFGCSTADRLLARHRQAVDPASPRTERGFRHPLDLMPSPFPGKVDPRVHPGAIEASGPLHVSPNGGWIAFESDRDGVHGVWVARRDGDGAHRVSDALMAVLPTWSPDGTRLAFLGRARQRPDTWSVWVVKAPDGHARKVSTGTVVVGGLAWFPDNRHICYGSHAWLVVVDTAATATRAFRLPTESSRIAGLPVVSPDGRWIVFAVAGEGAWMASIPDGSMTRIVSERDVDAFAWAPGGRQIAFRTARDGQWNVQIVRTEK
jgi:hypothetical protein